MTAVAEPQVTGRSTWVVLRRLLRVAPELKRGLGWTVLLAVVGTALSIVVPVVVQQLIDYEILDPEGVDVRGAVARGAVALGAMAVAALARRYSLFWLARQSARGLSDLRVVTFRHLHSLSALHVQAERRGSLVARVTSDVYRIQDFMDWGGVGMLVGAAQVVLAVVAMLVYQWQLALVVLAGVAMYAVLLVWFQRILRRAHDQVRERVADSLSAVGESISGLPVVRAYGVEGPTLERVRGALDAQFHAEYRTWRLGAFLFSSAEVFAGAITAAVIVAGVLWGPALGLSAGTLLAFLFLVNLLVMPVQTLVETIDAAQAAAAGVRRVLAVLDTPVDIPDPVDGRQLPPGPLGVTFEGVRFRYPESDYVLQDVSVDIPAGSRVAVVGETGSGKTTFAKLVTRLLDPTEGRVLVGGVPLDQVRFASLRSRVAYVPQEGFLFDATVGDNVRYGRREASDEEMWAAFTALELDGWLAELPRGLDTPVGERGAQLSAGERQLVALVRAFMVDPDLLVLDEATSAVDPSLDVRLRRAIDRFIRGRTSITVAHRLSTAEASDRVLVFDQGRLVEQGHHDQLVAAGGVYSLLFRDWMIGARTGGRGGGEAV